jgi:glycosyltransferase involved in cell wall biosynthesis
MQRPRLTIAIPSYNRAAFLDAQIAWAVRSIGDRWDECQLIVSDNASTDLTVEVCKKWQAQLGERIKVFHHPRNLKLPGNMAFCVKQAAGEYVWTVSDDDEMRPDVVSAGLRLLAANREIALLHMNFRCVNTLDGQVISQRFYGYPQDRYTARAMPLVEECLLRDEAGITFMSVNILNRALAVESLSAWPDAAKNFALPLYMAAYVASRGPMYLLAEPMCDAMMARPSWRDRDVTVLFKEMPEIYRQLIKLGYNRQVMNQLIRQRLKFEFVSFKALAKFMLKFPGDFLRTIPYYVSAIRD